MARILLVEDDPSALQALCHLIRTQGHTALAAEDARVAVKVLQDAKGDIELVATDICMPGGITGIQLGRMIALCYPNAKVLYFSAHDREDLHRLGLHLPDSMPLITK